MAGIMVSKEFALKVEGKEVYFQIIGGESRFELESVSRHNGGWRVSGRLGHFEINRGVNTTIDNGLENFLAAQKAAEKEALRLSDPVEYARRQARKQAKHAQRVMAEQKARKAREALRKELSSLRWQELVSRAHKAGVQVFVKGANRANLVDQLVNA